MENQFIPVGDNQQLELLIARSHETPVLLFKHSTTCPISAAAYREVQQLATEIALVVVQRAREVSREVETRTGVRHESPQALILKHGEAVWSASHWHITAEAVEQAMREHA